MFKFRDTKKVCPLPIFRKLFSTRLYFYQITIEHNDLEADEVNIISGALELKKKTVEHIMTRLEDIFMLPLEGHLDFETLNEIRKQGRM